MVDNQVLADRLDHFIALLNDSDFLFDAASVRRAIEQRGLFQLFDTVEALKLDI